MSVWTEGEIDFSRIDTADRSLAVTTKRDIETLARHIERFGLLSAPIVRESAGTYRIVAGFRRIDACQAIGWRRIAVRVIDAADADCAEIAIADNTGERKLNWIETARAYALLRQHWPDQDSLLHRAEELGLSANADVLRKTTELLGLPERIQQWVAHDILSLGMALELGRLEQRADALAVGELFGELKLGLNRQREFLGYLSDIARRNRCSIRHVLTEPDITGIRENPDLAAPDKSNRLRTLLRKKRYPQMCAFEERYYRNLKELHLPKGTSLVPPEHFEGGTWRMEILFEKPDELRNTIETLRNTLQRPIFSNLLT